MHKRIVEAIKLAITQREKELFDIYIQPQKTGGFWKMVIFVKPNYEHIISHIAVIGERIGAFYGEGLYVDKGKNYVRFS